MEHSMERAPAFFVWVLPILWGACSLAQSKSPGDENGFYVLSSIPAAWIAPFILLGCGSKEAIPVFVVLAGVPVMAGIGWGMDRLRVRKILWAVLYLAGGLAALVLALSSFPSIERAVSANGSLWAYVLLASNLGLYASVALSVILTCIARGVRWSAAISKEAWRAIKEPDHH
jgi:hypothetical protein